MATDVTDFDTEVIEASREAPVLVDFWAPWCGPCRTLGPVLEKLDSEAAGAWTLAKVNTDEMPEQSVRYGIRGIPAVKLFVDGDVVDEFTGALPEYAVRQWLEKALPSATQGELQAAEDALLAGETDKARGLLESVLSDQPTNAAASALLAGLVLFEDPDRAEQLAATGMTGEPRHIQMSTAVRTLRTLVAEEQDLPDGAGREHALTALQSLRNRDFSGSAEAIITLLQVDRSYGNDFARRLGVALFTLIGPSDPAAALRRNFDMWLT